MDLTKSILGSVREAVGLAYDNSDFDAELLLHINGGLGTLNQNGVGNIIVVNDETTKWEEFRNPEQNRVNELFQFVPLYILMVTKMIFDPPPPSTMDYYSQNQQQLLWRLKTASELEGL